MRRFRSHIWILASLFALCSIQVARGQSSLSKDFSVLTFDGGTAFVDVRFGSNLMGSGISGGSFSGIHSALGRVDGGAVFGNPASLAHVSYAQIGFESRFPIRNGSLGLGSTTWLPRSIETGTDNLLEDLSLPVGVQPTYTSASFAVLGQPRQLSAFWLTWPVKETVGIGFGYRQPLQVSSLLALSGAETFLSGNKETNGQSVQVDWLAKLSLNSNLQIQVDEISMGAGGLLEKYPFGSVWWGATFYRLGATVNLGLEARPQGVVTIADTDQYYFNDERDQNLNPSIGETNAFFWKVEGGFKGNGFGARLGLVHRTYKSRLGTSLLLDIAPRIELWDGNASARSYLPVFMLLEGVLDNARDSQDLLDIQQVDLDRPNLTRQSHDAIGQWMSVHMPTSLSFGVDLPLGRHLLVFNAMRYWGSFALEGEYGLEGGVLQRYKLGKKPSWGLKMGLDFARTRHRFGWNIPLRIVTLDIDGVLFEMFDEWSGYENPRYRFSGSLQWGAPIVHGVDSTISEDLEAFFGGMIPTSLAISRMYSLFDRLDVGVHVIGVPDLMMRFSLGLNVD
jgi:hypothetical protein